MLRTLFVSGLLLVGWGFALQSTLYAACLYLWIAYFRPESWAWNDLFTQLNLSYIAGAYLVLRVVLSGAAFRLTLRSSLLLVFLAHSLVSTALGPQSAFSFTQWQEFAKTIVVSVILTSVIKTAAEFRLILIVIALSLGFEGTKQGWANLILHPGGRNDNFIPFLGDNNLVAVGMLMLLPVIGALAETSSGWVKRAFQFMNIGVLYRALSTYSRGGFLSAAAVGALWFWRSPHKLKTVAAVVIAIAIVLPVLPQEFWDRMATITAPSEQRDDSAASRLHFWNVAIAMADDRPLTGVGVAAYSLQYNRYDFSPQGQYGANRAVHSAWFGVLAELGYPGLLLFIIIIIVSLLSCRRVRLSANRGEVPVALGKYAVALETALIAFIVGGSFVSFHYCEMLWHFFALTFALERVAVTEAAVSRAPREDEQPIPAAPPVTEPDRDFAWT
jgi:probable O-glycosylation ligase (exosortase A-associated)